MYLKGELIECPRCEEQAEGILRFDGRAKPTLISVLCFNCGLRKKINIKEHMAYMEKCKKEQK